ncbi:MAG TPA: LUD domain-containing protein, partial [Bacteroidales bacterium]|nr:LUD domain-containing protein [Bacteroidales bacterium]
MGSNGFGIFRNSISEKLSDSVLQQSMQKNTAHYERQFNEGITQFNDFEGCRERLSYLRKRALNNLDKYLLEFENRFIHSGGTVYWADSVDDVARILSEILPDNPGIVVKSKSMTGEETGFNSIAQEKGYEVVETDLGEFIVQQMGQKPSHITAPAIHLSKTQIADFFNTRFGSKKDASAEEITDFVRKLLRTKFTESTVGVTGANFIIADTGSVAITENEGNASMVTSWPRKHIVIAGIEKVIPSIKDLYLYWPMLASHATGQKLS